MALIMTTLFVLVVVVGRVVLQYRLSGDHGIRFTRGPLFNSKRLASYFSGFAIAGTIIISALSAFSIIKPQVQLGNFGNVLGLLFCIGGIVFTSLSQVKMGKEWRIGVDENERTELVCDGIYSLIRNPIYTGIMIFGMGLLLLVPHISMLTFAVFVYIAIEYHVRKIEEPYLRKLHGQVYDDYANSTGRYIPKK